MKNGCGRKRPHPPGRADEVVLERFEKFCFAAPAELDPGGALQPGKRDEKRLPGMAGVQCHALFEQGSIRLCKSAADYLPDTEVPHLDLAGVGAQPHFAVLRNGVGVEHLEHERAVHKKKAVAVNAAGLDKVKAPPFKGEKGSGSAREAGGVAFDARFPVPPAGEPGNVAFARIVVGHVPAGGAPGKVEVVLAGEHRAALKLQEDVPGIVLFGVQDAAGIPDVFAAYPAVCHGPNAVLMLPVPFQRGVVLRAARDDGTLL